MLRILIADDEVSIIQLIRKLIRPELGLRLWERPRMEKARWL